MSLILLAFYHSPKGNYMYLFISNDVYSFLISTRCETSSSRSSMVNNKLFEAMDTMESLIFFLENTKILIFRIFTTSLWQSILSNLLMATRFSFFFQIDFSACEHRVCFINLFAQTSIDFCRPFSFLHNNRINRKKPWHPFYAENWASISPWQWFIDHFDQISIDFPFR